MPTLLTNRKMDPALAARIEACLGQSAGRPRPALYRAWLVAFARAAGVLAAIAAAVAVYLVALRARERFERRRGALLDAVTVQAKGLSDADRATLGRAEAALRRLAAPWPGELVAGELRTRGLPALLASPTLYVRADLDDVVRGRAVAAITRDARKDALLLCLVDPPASRDEMPLVAKVRDAWDAETIDKRTASVVLLRDAAAGLPFLDPTWLARVQIAPTPTALGRLEDAFAKAPIEAAKRAARARYLLAALDEGPSAAGLEGDRPHDVRVALVDLDSSAVLLRARKHVDPSWVSPSRRAKYSVDLDGCTLALDVREAIAGAPR